MLRRSFAFLVAFLPFAAHAQVGEMLSPKCKNTFIFLNKMQDEIRQAYQSRQLHPPLDQYFQQTYQDIGIHNMLVLQNAEVAAAMDTIRTWQKISPSENKMLAEWEAAGDGDRSDLGCGDLTKLQSFAVPKEKK